jgi:hypothetical protein
MISRIALVGTLVLSCSSAILAQQSSSPEAYTDEDAYQVYDALLPQDSSLSTVVIDANTSGQIAGGRAKRGPEACIAPAAAAEFKDAIDDYNRVNQNKWLLQRKFSLQRPYEILDLATSGPLFADGWKKFYQRFPKSRGILEMSAVGFNKDRTRAIVYFGNSCGMLCGGWSFELLKKVDGKWQSVPGITCNTVS